MSLFLVRKVIRPFNTDIWFCLVYRDSLPLQECNSRCNIIYLSSTPKAKTKTLSYYRETNFFEDIT